jgi:hypothetical protein
MAGCARRHPVALSVGSQQRPVNQTAGEGEKEGEEVEATRRAMATRALTRRVATGIDPLRGVPRDLQRAVRNRAVNEKTTLHRVLR